MIIQILIQRNLHICCDILKSMNLKDAGSFFLEKTTPIRGFVSKWSDKTIITINTITSYGLVLLLWAPHGARECSTPACDGPYFISPLLSVFIMPNWIVDMSLYGWMLQVVFSPPLLLALWGLRTLSRKKWFAFIKIDAVRWTIMWFVILAYYNLVFWSSLRETLLPFFAFPHA